MEKGDEGPERRFRAPEYVGRDGDADSREPPVERQGAVRFRREGDTEDQVITVFRPVTIISVS